MGNAERARAALKAWNEGGLRALSDGWWTDDISWHDLPSLPDPVVTRGREAVESRVEEMVAVLGRFRFIVKNVEEHGDQTLAELELVGEGAQSGAFFSGTVHQVCSWRDGRTAEVLTFADRAVAQAALVSNARSARARSPGAARGP